MWNYVISHFKQFLGELNLDPATRQDGEAKAQRVARSLFTNYYPNRIFDPCCYSIVGSYAKGTAAKPRTDIDMIFVIPKEEFPRINALSGNKQSQLLQEVKRSLLQTFPLTDIRGDGPVVKVPFSTYYFEVVPVFDRQDGSFANAHTKRGGYWGYTHPAAEVDWLRKIDAQTMDKASHLVKMLKAWKRECNVKIRSICLEVAATCFLDQWIYKDKTIYFYDWMVRDFFAYLSSLVNGSIKPAGIAEWIPLGDCWHCKCQSAYVRALKACDYEHADQSTLAIAEWQKIFGPQFKYGSLLETLMAAQFSNATSQFGTQTQA